MTQNVKIDNVEARAEQCTLTLLKTIPKIREYIETDIEAIFEGDPAAAVSYTHLTLPTN